MKKFLTIFFIVMTANISLASAEMLRISEGGVNELVRSIAAIVYDEQFQKEKPLLLTNFSKFENGEFPEIGKEIFAGQFGLKTSNAAEGEITFFVDNEEKVSAMKIVGYNNSAAEDAGVLLLVALQVLGLTQADAEFLLTNLNDDETLASSIVWSEEKQRCFVLMAGARPQAAEGFQFVLVASDKKE